MTSKQHKLAVVIMRAQPFHMGHYHLINEARKIADEVAILLGSAGESRSLKNPFTYEERKSMIIEELDSLSGIHFFPAYDYLYDDDIWSGEIIETIKENFDDLHQSEIIIVGHDKDETSFYLHTFPWAAIEVDNKDEINATDIRKDYFFGAYDFHSDKRTGYSVSAFLEEFATTDEYAKLKQEQTAVWAYKQSWAGSPFPPVFVATDAIVRYKDKIALIVRGGEFGVNKLALPGGYLEHDKTIFSNCLKELEEETGLSLFCMESYLVGIEIYDKVNRSPRGRMITHCYYFDITDCPTSSLDYDENGYPLLTAGDDAVNALWLNLEEIKANRDKFFSDHWSIIFNMLRDNYYE